MRDHIDEAHAYLSHDVVDVSAAIRGEGRPPTWYCYEPLPCDPSHQVAAAAASALPARKRGLGDHEGAIGLAAPLRVALLDKRNEGF